MLNSVPLLIGLRYIRAKRRNAFISFVSLFAFIGMALGVFALILVLSVMNGFDNELKQRILRAVPHGFITETQGLGQGESDWKSLQARLENHAIVKGASPFVQSTGLLSVEGLSRAVEIIGIEPETEKSVSVLHDYMLAGSMDALQPRGYGIVMGVLLARTLGVTIGDRVTVTLPKVSITPAGIFPRSRRFIVQGVFEVGAQLDQSLILMNMSDAQRLFQRGSQVDGIRLHFDNIYSAPSHIQTLQTYLGDGFDGKDWSQTQGNLFGAIKMEKTVVGILLGIIVIVAAFNIVTSLIMMVAEKRSDIAVLRTMGMRRRGIVAIFMAQGLTLGVVGIAIGLVFGLIAALNISDGMAWFESISGMQLFDPSVYYVSYLPSDWRLSDTLVVSLGAFIMSFLASCYPAYKASQIMPAEALRYDI